MGRGAEGSGQLRGESIRMDRDWDLIRLGSKGGEDGRIPARFLAPSPWRMVSHQCRREEGGEEEQAGEGR